MYSTKDLLLKTQYQAYCVVKQLINKFPSEWVRYKDGHYLVMGIDIEVNKPMLCVHLDTINTHRGIDKPLNEEDILYNRDTKTYSLNPNSQLTCLGGDDRAGLWIAIKLLTDKSISSKYCYGFFFNEEIGGKGSTEYMKDYPNYEDGVSCFIGLDRRGDTEVATYGKDNQELIKLFEDVGYKEAMGSFTDASNLATYKACCNLSVGYNNEHTHNETLDFTAMEATLEVLRFISHNFKEEYPVEHFGYDYEKYDRYSGYYLDKPEPVLCDICGSHSGLYREDDYLICMDCLDYTKELV
jgi:hypothetical protein